jgi:acetyl-CoA synthetase
MAVRQTPPCAGATTNICYNVLDRHIERGNGHKIAFYWFVGRAKTTLPLADHSHSFREGNEPMDYSTITYVQLHERVQRFANVLKSLGVKKGHTVAIYQPMIVDLVVAMLACARIGAPHSVVVSFSGPVGDVLL